MNEKSPSYLVQQRCGYCFRITVPPDLCAVVGRKELRYSLRTGTVGEAKYRARRMAGFVQGLFREMRNDGQMKELSEADIKRMLDDYLMKTLQADEHSRIESFAPLDEKTHSELVGEHDYLKNLFQEELRLCNYEHSAGILKKWVLPEKDIAIDEQSDTFRQLCRELAKVMVVHFSIAGKREMGDYIFEGELLPKIRPKIPSSTVQQKAEPAGEGLFRVVELYVQEQEAGGNWSKKSRVEYTACLELLKEFLGDIPVKAIDYASMQEYKQALLRLPPNMKKSPLYRDKSLAEILKMEVNATWAIPTVNKYLNRASCLFEYAVKNGFMDKNPGKGMEIPIKKRDSEQRSLFSEDDLNKLFRSTDYLEDGHTHSYQFWLPVLGLYTGCRLEELAQLHLDDIRGVDGVWVFDINDKGEKKIKSQAGVRLVPIHPFLRDGLKIVQYAERLRREGYDRLFPELSRRRDGYGQTVSKWFNDRYKVKCGIVTGPGEKKDFHSFRHTFINTLKQDRVDGTMLAELVGHSVDSMTMGRYGKRYAPTVLLEDVVMKLHYDVELSHLAESRFVRGV